MAVIKNMALLAFCLILLACGGSNESSNEVSTSSTIIQPDFIVPDFNATASMAVGNESQTNSQGQFNQPTDGESFDGNILVSVQVSDPDGLVRVALSFNQSAQLKYLCEPGDDCPLGQFSKTETNINPADYGVYVGPLTVGLWTIDQLNQQQLVDTLTLDWQHRRVAGVSVSRSQDGSQIDISWQQSTDLLRYNVFVAAESGVNISNYQQLQQGQAFLSLTSSSQQISGITPFQEYFVIVTGVDGSGESAYSSEYRLAPYSGQANTSPQPNTDVFSSAENQPINGNVLTNDNDAENDQLSVSPLPLKFPLNGAVTLNRDGSFIYQPEANFSGADSFIYEIQDGQGGLAQGLVNISIDNVNDPPVALDDSYVAVGNQQLTVDAPGILANDIDIDGDNISVNTTPVIDVSNGQLTLAADGGFTYLANSGFSGTDSFRYQISDPFNLTAEALVTIEVDGMNNPPIANNDSYAVDEDQTLVVDETSGILANDTDADGDTINLEPNLLATVTNGMLTLEDNGAFIYIPNANFFGSDSFQYQINDGNGGLAQATVQLDISPVNDAPDALDDDYVTAFDTALNVSAPGLLANDSDIEQDMLFVDTTPVSMPQNGALSLFEDGSIDYTPNTGFSGQDSFTYQVQDGSGATDIAQVQITVQEQIIWVRGQSTNPTGLLTLTGLGESSPGSGIGQVRYLLGDCVQQTDTVCTLTGTYQETAQSDYNPGGRGQFIMEFTYAGTGPSPVIAESTQPGGNSVVFVELGVGLYTLTLTPESGSPLVGQFPAAVFENSIGFNAFFGGNANCTGLAIGQSCGVGQVGLTPGAEISGNVTPFNFVIPML